MMRFLVYLALVLCMALKIDAQQEPVKTPVLSDQPELLNHILKVAQGHHEFRELELKQHEEEFVRLVNEGQSPKVLFIGCSDSRVVPNLILKTRPGDLFVIRNAGNFVPPYRFQSVDGIAASIQYAIEVLNIPHIIVCGHSDCGAIQGLFKDLPDNLEIVRQWLKLGEKAKAMTIAASKPNTPKEELYTTAEEISVIIQLENLMTYPFIKKKVEEGKVFLHGWYFKIQAGQLFYYNAEKYRFFPLDGR